jgi:hypothetical protein
MRVSMMQATADARLTLCAVRPLASAGTPLLSLENKSAKMLTRPFIPNQAATTPTIVTAMAFESMPDGSCVLYTGDESGFIKRWDMTAAIDGLGLKPVSLTHPNARRLCNVTVRMWHNRKG